ncbi:MAG: PCMD domain-containing protein [Alistipes sp.]|nr:PCMD domain-containing protein [Alistipes sp.]
MKSVNQLEGVVLMGMLLLTSCIQDEALNAEADILSIVVPKEILKIQPSIKNESVMILVNKGVDLTHLAPDFVLSEGATISPKGKTEQDFSIPRKYTVTSQDGCWKKEYIVSFVDADLTTQYDFEQIEVHDGRYHVFQEKENDQVIMEWGSGNAGFAITGVAKSPSDYPTLQSSAGRTGNCLQMITRSTGSFGAQVGMPIAAGNCFIGSFEVKSALSNPLKSTRFGMPFQYMPTYITGYYKYAPGSDYRERGVSVEGKKDAFHIYAMFFETDAQLQTLDGTNQFTDPHIVAMAKFSDEAAHDTWTKFEIPMEYSKAVDAQKLAAGGYSLALVFTSSIHGDVFCGAINSTLWIDDVEILYAQPKE